jgi:S1-C subfamily serine protease
MKIFKSFQLFGLLAFGFSTLVISFLVLALAPGNLLAYANQFDDGFEPPRNLGMHISKAQLSTVIVECEANGGSFGSGWAIDKRFLEPKILESGKNFFITAHHVVEDCMKTKELNIYSKESEEAFAGLLVAWDKNKDLAVVASSLKLPELRVSNYQPREGHWVMAVGAPEAYEASVTFGYIMNHSKDDLLFTAPIAGGSSGGPLLNNKGDVVGTVTASAIDGEFNFATSLENMCRKFLICGEK